MCLPVCDDMKPFFKKILFICFGLFTYIGLGAQVRFYAAISPGKINKDAYVTYRIVIDNPTSIDNISTPSFKNFTIVSGPVQENGVSSLNGNPTTFVSMVYVLKPRRTGRMIIGPALANIDGKIYKSNAVNFLVSNALSATTPSLAGFPAFDPFQERRSDFNDYIFRKGENVGDKVNKNMLLRLETDKTTCYVGEPIVAVYKLYTRLKSESKLVQNPSFNGFSVIDMQQPDISNYRQGHLNGREFNVYTIRKAQLYPLQSGIINLESAELENNISFIKEDHVKPRPDALSFFDDFPGSGYSADALINQTVNLKSLPVNITVKSLPPANKPETFNGAVGNFSIESSLQKPLFSTDESGKLIVTITGSGNLQLLTAPDILWPKGIEIFEPKVSDNLIKATVPVSGSKRFEYTFSVNDSGHYVLPSIRFSYFDPVTAIYKTVSTDNLDFQVTLNKRNHPALKFAVNPGKPSLLNRIFFHRGWIILLIAAIMFSGLIVWLIKDRKVTLLQNKSAEKIQEDTVINIMETSIANRQNVFSESAKCLAHADCSSFYTLLNVELKRFLAEKFSLNINTINSDNIAAVMDEKGIANNITLKLQRLMQRIEWQLYTPSERDEHMHDLYEEAYETVQMINAAETNFL